MRKPRGIRRSRLTTFPDTAEVVVEMLEADAEWTPSERGVPSVGAVYPIFRVR